MDVFEGKECINIHIFVAFSRLECCFHI